MLIINIIDIIDIDMNIIDIDIDIVDNVDNKYY